MLWAMSMSMRLELVPLPARNIDAAISFYTAKVGFILDHDVSPADGVRVVQLTPPGSSCSIAFLQGLPAVGAQSGSVNGLHLVVDDIDAVYNSLTSQGVDVSGVADVGGGVRMAHFADPDGNTWALQQLPHRP